MRQFFLRAVFEINPDSAKRYISPAIYGVNTVPLTNDNVNTFLPAANLKAERIWRQQGNWIQLGKQLLQCRKRLDSQQ